MFNTIKATSIKPLFQSSFYIHYSLSIIETLGNNVGFEIWGLINTAMKMWEFLLQLMLFILTNITLWSRVLSGCFLILVSSMLLPLLFRYMPKLRLWITWELSQQLVSITILESIKNFVSHIHNNNIQKHTCTSLQSVV